MSLKLNSSGGGSVTLQEPTTASTRTLDLPDNSGTVVSTGSTAVVSQAMLAAGVAGTGPAFSAYQGSAQSISANTATKLTIATEEFDTANCYDTTLSRFTPNVAGYYLVTGRSRSNGLTNLFVSIYRNGSPWKNGVGGDNDMYACTVSALVYLNGTTDYVELYTSYSSNLNSLSGQSETYFQAFLARSA